MIINCDEMKSGLRVVPQLIQKLCSKRRFVFIFLTIISFMSKRNVYKKLYFEPNTKYIVDLAKYDTDNMNLD